MKKFIMWIKFAIAVLCACFNNHKDVEKPTK